MSIALKEKPITQILSEILTRLSLLEKKIEKYELMRKQFLELCDVVGKDLEQGLKRLES